MIFTETSIPGAFLIEPERLCDERGFFARTWCEKDFTARGLNANLAQCSTSFNAKEGTLRGLHYQAPPHMETKLVRATRGAVFDVIVDLREGSRTFGKWAGFELSAENGHALYIPEGIAHGFQTLLPETEVFYQISTHYAPESARGVAWDDPDLAIAWPPADKRIISAGDAGRPRLVDILPLSRAA